jgi:hypothetical protein
LLRIGADGEHSVRCSTNFEQPHASHDNGLTERPAEALLRAVSPARLWFFDHPRGRGLALFDSSRI